MYNPPQYAIIQQMIAPQKIARGICAALEACPVILYDIKCSESTNMPANPQTLITQNGTLRTLKHNKCRIHISFFFAFNRLFNI